MVAKKNKAKKKIQGRKYVSFGGVADYVHSQQQYYNVIPKNIKYRNKIKELEERIDEGGLVLNEGKNIKLEKNANKSVTINVALKNNYEEHYSSGEYILKSGSDLDDVTSLLIKSINDNSDAIDGENISIP